MSDRFRAIHTEDSLVKRKGALAQPRSVQSATERGWLAPREWDSLLARTPPVRFAGNWERFERAQRHRRIEREAQPCACFSPTDCLRACAEREGPLVELVGCDARGAVAAGAGAAAAAVATRRVAWWRDATSVALVAVGPTQSWDFVMKRDDRATRGWPSCDWLERELSGGELPLGCLREFRRGRVRGRSGRPFRGSRGS
jgi:hypothetical protein